MGNLMQRCERRPRLHDFVLVGLALALAAILAWRAIGAHAANAELYRRLSEAEAELGRQEARRESLEAEFHALEQDPMYIERLLRLAHRVGPDERTIGER